MFVGRPMKENFEKLNNRILKAIEETDTKALFGQLASIKTPTLTSGVGGSSVVSVFLSEVLKKKNGIIAHHCSPRDFVHQDLNMYDNVVACSYSGGNIGVDASFNNLLNHYLFSKNVRENVENLIYCSSDPEFSYISLAATLIPMSLLLMYYTDSDLTLLKEILNTPGNFEADDVNLIEIMSGCDSVTAATVLESTMVESGIAIPVIHDKYNYCHGRTNLHRSFEADIILFKGDGELDKLYDDVLKQQGYHRVIRFEKKYEDELINDFYWAVQCYDVCRVIAQHKGIDLSTIKEAEYNDIYYLYKGEL